MHPAQKLGVVGGVQLRRERPGQPFSSSLDAVVDDIDGSGSRGHFLVGAEGEGEHGPHRLSQAGEAAPGMGAKRTVVRDGRRYQGVGELQEDRPRPTEEHHDLGIHLPDDALRAEPGMAHSTLDGGPRVWRALAPDPA